VGEVVDVVVSAVLPVVDEVVCVPVVWVGSASSSLAAHAAKDTAQPAEMDAATKRRERPEFKLGFITRLSSPPRGTGGFYHRANYARPAETLACTCAHFARAFLNFCSIIWLVFFQVVIFHISSNRAL